MTDMTHCERYCVPSCDSCARELYCYLAGTPRTAPGTEACGGWECVRDPATCFGDAQAAEADRIHDARMEEEKP